MLEKNFRNHGFYFRHSDPEKDLIRNTSLLGKLGNKFYNDKVNRYFEVSDSNRFFKIIQIVL